MTTPKSSGSRRLVLVTAVATALLSVGSAAAATAPAQDAQDTETVVSRDRNQPRLTHAQRRVLREATHRFRDVDAATAAGYVPTDDCVPGMGFHYGNPPLAGDLNIDPTLPEILVYEPTQDDSVRLVALEYFRADADGDKATDDDRPTLFGHPFDGPMDGHPVPPGTPPMPVHYDLHVWLYKRNPAGELTPENPEVDCPADTGP